MDQRPRLLVVDLEPLGNSGLVVVRALRQVVRQAGLGTRFAVRLSRR